jgi:hypothetical protein
MADTFTEVTNQSWGSRIGNSIKGIIGAVALVYFFIIVKRKKTT